MALNIRPVLVFFVITAFTLVVNGNMDPCPCRTGYNKIGCYDDPGSYGDMHLRPFSELLLNLRHQLVSLTIWTEGWNDYLKDMTCRCAALAKQKGYKYFGLQFYGECWSGPANLSILSNLTPSKRCWGYRPHFRNCVDDSPTECIGEAHHNYIYKVLPEEWNVVLVLRNGKSAQCHIDGAVPEGCIGGGSGATTSPTTTKVTTTEKPRPFNPCISRPCKNGGECIYNGSDYLCECPTNYIGRNCQIHIG